MVKEVRFDLTCSGAEILWQLTHAGAQGTLIYRLRKRMNGTPVECPRSASGQQHRRDSQKSGRIGRLGLLVNEETEVFSESRLTQMIEREGGDLRRASGRTNAT